MAERMTASRLAARSGAGYVPQASDSAGLGLRALAYLIDSVALFVFAALFATVAGLNVFLRTDAGQENPSDGAIWASVVILMLTVPGWLLLNLALGLKRAQSIGQYVIGLRVATEAGGAPSAGRWLLYWLALHPLLFHPFIAGFWALFAFVTLSLAANDIVFMGSLAMALLSLVAPVAGLVFALGDRRHRAIHDRIAGTKVVRLE